MPGEDCVAIEVAVALPDVQHVRTLTVPAGTTARDAVRLSCIADAVPGIDVGAAPLGVFGRVVAEDYRVTEGDRVEIYRPLRQAPPEARRLRAAGGQS